MVNVKQYLSLEKLEAYCLSRELSRIGWEIYSALEWRIKKILGDQFITSTDSTGANIAEGYGRFHYLDKNKFYYNARGSLFESKHWFDLLAERKLIKDSHEKSYLEIYQKLRFSLNGLIKLTKETKNNL